MLVGPHYRYPDGRDYGCLCKTHELVHLYSENQGGLRVMSDMPA